MVEGQGQFPRIHDFERLEVSSLIEQRERVRMLIENGHDRAAISTAAWPIVSQALNDLSAYMPQLGKGDREAALNTMARIRKENISTCDRCGGSIGAFNTHLPDGPNGACREVQ